MLTSFGKPFIGYIQEKFSGEVHNAKKCTIDGRDLFIASIECSSKLYNMPSMHANVEEFSTKEEARIWCTKKLQQLGMVKCIISERD